MTNWNLIDDIKDMLIMDIGKACPNCGSGQFYISYKEAGYPLSPDDWPKGVLGLSECRNCDRPFFVGLTEELQNSVEALLVHSKIGNVSEVMKALFGR